MTESAGLETASAYQHWDSTWQDDSGAVSWSRPDPWVVRTVPQLWKCGVRTVLDLGCGVGRHAIYLAQQGFTCRGIDLSTSGIARAEQDAKRAGVPIDFTIGEFSRLPYAAGEFDYVLAYNVIYHGDREVVRRTIEEIRRVLRPGGLYQCTMLSTRNAECGRGIEISPGTFRQPDALDDKVHPHFYCDARSLLSLHEDLDLLSAFDAEHDNEGSYHWHCLFEATDDRGASRPRSAAT